MLLQFWTDAVETLSLRRREGRLVRHPSATPQWFAIAYQVTPTDTINLQWQRYLSIGDVGSSFSKSAGELASYEESLALRRRLAKIDPSNTQWQRDEAYVLDRIGDEYRILRMSHRAMAAY